MGTLRTLSWAYINNERSCVEIVVDLNNVTSVIAYSDPSGAATSLLILKKDNPNKKGETIHVDIPIDQMERIIHQHSIRPTKQFRTHQFFSKKNTKKS